MTLSTAARALTVLGDSWTLLILQRGFIGVRRFSDWCAALGISESVLAGRLRTLTEAGMLQATPYREGGRSRTEYRLTPRSLDLWSTYIAAWSWERAHLPQPVHPELIHDACGAGIDVTLVCASCGRPVGPRDTETTVLMPSTLAGVRRRVNPRRSRTGLPTDPYSQFPGTVELLGDRWSTAVVAAALLGVRTFGGFQETLGVSPDVLSDRLRRFVDVGLFDATGGGYRLTDSGRDTFCILMLALSWADRWLGPEGHPSPLHVRHRACGELFEPALNCTVCHKRLERSAVRFTRPVRTGD